ncbi:sugar transferase [Microbacterium oryzae]|uniref:sugar transferase n=1 Tax=Microbacterium oryzae TaxID=743009 RepID=UPI0025AF219C|nr:sugar transferase [Microbacterium oryzae]MDN3310130.1 sugar transferase [Microbacterium oryzae]
MTALEETLATLRPRRRIGLRPLREVVGREPSALRPTEETHEVAVERPVASPYATAAAPRTATALARRLRIERGQRLLTAATDAVVVSAAAILAWVLAPLLGAQPDALPCALSAAVWWTALLVGRSRSATATTARQRLLAPTVVAFGLLTMAFVAVESDAIRPVLLVAAPVGLAGLALSREALRLRATVRRRAGHDLASALLVGRAIDVEGFAAALARDDANGYRIDGSVLIEDTADPSEVIERVTAAAASLGTDTVIVASAPPAGSDLIKRLGWRLEGLAAEIVVANGLRDTAPSRLALLQIQGVPFVQVQVPRYRGASHLAKRAVDVVVSALALVAIGAVLPVIALAIKLDSPGPVFFLQERIGRDGRPFRMVKFRSMSQSAEAERERLEAANEGAGPLFKLRDDPRVTTVGRFLRKFSVDELPQFWNVLRGDMSVVGPRPPLPREVFAYERSAYRRLYVKPGITGPWQVGGRSDLTWEESVSIDLRYVENWSIATDLKIILRTAAVVVRPKGAY